jgi:uncharacterized protein (UPF0335 family)
MQSLDDGERKAVFGEVLLDELKAIREYVSDIPAMKRDIAVLKTDVSELKSDVAGLRLDVKMIRLDVREINRHKSR